MERGGQGYMVGLATPCDRWDMRNDREEGSKDDSCVSGLNTSVVAAEES